MAASTYENKTLFTLACEQKHDNLTGGRDIAVRCKTLVPSTALLAGAIASLELHPLRRAQRLWQMKSSVQHPLIDERAEVLS